MSRETAPWHYEVPETAPFPWMQPILDVRREISARGEEMFFGIPDAWYEPYTVRCGGGHVSNRVLGTEKGAQCLECFSPCMITYPGDKDGPFEPEKARHWRRGG